jgi:hypothetical protein
MRWSGNQNNAANEALLIQLLDWNSDPVVAWHVLIAETDELSSAVFRAQEDHSSEGSTLYLSRLSRSLDQNVLGDSLKGGSRDGYT